MQGWLLRQWRDISGNVKFWLLGILGLAVMSGAVSITHGLLLWQQIVLMALFISLFAWVIIATLSAKRSKALITPENVRARIREWLDAFNFEHAVPPPWHEWNFSYRVILPRGPLLFIAQTKAQSDSLLFRGLITAVSPKHRLAYDALSEREQEELYHQLSLETSRAKFFFNSDQSLNQVTFESWLPIDSLTASTFIDTINQMYFSANILWSTISLHLGGKPEPMPPSSTPDTEGSPPSQ